LPIRSAHHDALVRFLQAPAFGDEAGGEPVEQFGMRGACADEAEVARRADEAGAEVVMPETVHGDAGGERLGFTREPFRKRSAALRLGRVGGKLETTEHRKSTGADGIARLLRITAREDMDPLGLGELAREDFGANAQVGLATPQLGEFLFEIAPGVDGGGIESFAA
jgi:hypothetical protein